MPLRLLESLYGITLSLSIPKVEFVVYYKNIGEFLGNREKKRLHFLGGAVFAAAIMEFDYAICYEKFLATLSAASRRSDKMSLIVYPKIVVVGPERLIEAIRLPSVSSIGTAMQVMPISSSSDSMA